VGDHPTPTDHSGAWRWYQFGFGLAFTHFCLVSGSLLPNFLVIVAHSIFNMVSGGMPLDRGGTCIEDFVLVGCNIVKYWGAMGVGWSWTDFLDDPVQYICCWSYLVNLLVLFL